MTRSLNRLTAAILISFLAMGIALVYWSVFVSDPLLARDDNPRNVEAERAILRGQIYDRSGAALARTLIAGTSPAGKPVIQRVYPHPDTATAVGYYSLIHGVGGTEAAFDPQLRGDDRQDALTVALNALFHRPQVGSDVRLTLDVTLQTSIVQALAGQQGAVIVLDVPSGAVLAMVSAPSYDPNHLDTAYNGLAVSPASPLLNRVTQGLYQPGGALESVILAALLTNKTDLNAQVPGAERDVTADGLILHCGLLGPAFTVKDAYARACPGIFADALTQPGAANIQKMFDAFGLLQAPTLVDYQTVAGFGVKPLDQITDPAQQLAQVVGQGDLTVTPIQMALVAAIIANRGNAIDAHLADAFRLPDTSDWQPIPDSNQGHAVIAQETAAQIAQAMRAAVTSGAAQAADRPGLAIMGHASIAYTGPRQQQAAWFIGFVDTGNGHAAAVAVVIENSADPAAAAAIGGTALQGAANLGH